MTTRERLNVLPPDRRFDFWHWAGAMKGPGGLRALLDAYERKVWRDTAITTPVVRYELTGHDLDHVRGRIIDLIRRTGGTAFRDGDRVWRTDGTRLWTALPGFD